MLLRKLIKNIPKNKKKILISGISSDSKKVRKNFIFFAIKGNQVNGEKYIREAISKGAVVIVCSKSYKINNENILIIRTDNIRSLLSETASRFYALKPNNIIAVTGTNGKTSVADMFYQIFRLNNIPAATIGTLGIKYNDKILKTDLTSPDTIALHKNLHNLKNKKIDNVIIEASSHGLVQKRLNNINFKAAVFTNFSQDHLDYHKTMKRYLDAKLVLFKKILRSRSFIISDNLIPQFLILKKIAKQKSLNLLDISKEIEKIKYSSIHLNDDFKIKNLAMAIIAAKICGLKEKKIYKVIKKIKDVDGRLELVKRYSDSVAVFIDYAHTPDALLKALSSLKINYGNNISLVFGCGGDRDKKKRSLMAKIANENCKKIYVTDDNPRNENPKKIRQELLKHIDKDKAFNIGNREMAIKRAIKDANLQEVILVAGKGHEEKQIYKNKILSISDKKIINKIKFKRKKINRIRKNFHQNEILLKKIQSKSKLKNFHGISIDTRTIKKDNLFVAIKGKNNDGNKFLASALKKGAGCITSGSHFFKNKNKNRILRVKNSISFLNQFAKLKRDHSLAKIIAITGSAGKTSLKNLIKDLLHNFGRTYSSPKSFNNHLGVPISLSNLSFDDKFGIFEVGMSRGNEIRKLTSIIKPHIGIITNIGEAHLENFKNIKGIAEAKSEIIENIQAGGIIILNRDDKFYNFLFRKANLYNLKTSSFGMHKESDVRLVKIFRKKNSSRVIIKMNNQLLDFEIRDLNIHNVLATLAILSFLKVDITDLGEKFKSLESSIGRGKKYSIFRYKKKFKLIDESYNANPLSVKNAIKNLSFIKKEKFKKYLILGDMLELGSKSKKYHEDLSKVINNSDIDKVFVKGKKTIFTYKLLNKDKRGNILQSNDDIDLSLSKMISDNDYLMIKGSNATGLNDFSKKMIKGL